MKTYLDQMGRKVELTQPPHRVVSLVPSITELLIDMGVNVVGRTKFCIHPKSKVQDIPVIGGTKNFRFEEIRALEPDLIIGNKEENYQEGIQTLEKEFPVWMSDINSLTDAEHMIKLLGNLFGDPDKAQHFISRLKLRLDGLKGAYGGRALYLIWKGPWMAAGTQTYINDFMGHLGYKNVITEDRYPELPTPKKFQILNPQHVLLSSEPFPFKKEHADEIRSFLPNANIRLINGEIFSWYGTRLLNCELKLGDNL
ncbi:MAG: helical backbone metal receptor [Marinoscillum sp.]